MERREMLGLLGAGAAGLAVLGRNEAHAEDQEKDGQSIMDECARVCNQTATHCLHKAHQSDSGGAQEHHLKAHQATMDCQAFCHLTSALMARHSPMAAYAHEACANACRDCAEACDKGQDEVMKQCAEICRRCEQHCRQHAKQGSGGTR